MPLEINEIGIRMQIGGLESQDKQDDENKPSPELGCGDVSRSEIVDDCVMRVLQILRTYQDR